MSFQPRYDNYIEGGWVAPVKPCRADTTTDTRPGQWVAISGIGGGLGHIAVQYARAMGLRVVRIDVDDSKLALATRLGAESSLTPAPPTWSPRCRRPPAACTACWSPRCRLGGSLQEDPCQTSSLRHCRCG
jgi:hypothetical protein